MRFEIFRKKGNARSVTIRFPTKATSTPIYFPAISTFGTDLSIKLVKFILQNPFPCMLISAYDYYNLYESDERLKQSINNYSTNGKFLLVDSGGYERKWNDDKKWDFSLYKSTMNKINADFYISLDIEELGVKSSQQFKNILDSYTVLKDRQFLPIFDGNNPKQLNQSIGRFLDSYPNFIQFIAVRERDCGVTLSEKARTIYKIRKLIDDRGNDQILHILGCGNPLSMALYSYYGADSFDSRDWYLKALDIESMSLRDFSHLELMNCKCKTCKISQENLYAKTIIHNIAAYLELVNKIQSHIKNEDLQDFLLRKGITKDMMTRIQTS